MIITQGATMKVIHGEILTIIQGAPEVTTTTRGITMIQGVITIQRVIMIVIIAEIVEETTYMEEVINIQVDLIVLEVMGDTKIIHQMNQNVLRHTTTFRITSLHMLISMFKKVNIINNISRGNSRTEAAESLTTIEEIIVIIIKLNVLEYLFINYLKITILSYVCMCYI